MKYPAYFSHTLGAFKNNQELLTIISDLEQEVQLYIKENTQRKELLKLVEEKQEYYKNKSKKRREKLKKILKWFNESKESLESWQGNYLYNRSKKDLKKLKEKYDNQNSDISPKKVNKKLKKIFDRLIEILD